MEYNKRIKDAEKNHAYWEGAGDMDTPRSFFQCICKPISHLILCNRKNSESLLEATSNNFHIF